MRTSVENTTEGKSVRQAFDMREDNRRQKWPKLSTSFKMTDFLDKHKVTKIVLTSGKSDN